MLTKRQAAICFFFSLLLGTLACQTNKVAKEGWAQKMETLYSSFVDLVPYIYDNNEYRSLKNRERILSLYDKLAYSVHQIEDSADKMPPDSDPILKVASQEMKANIEYAKFSFEKGYFDYSRGLMQYTANQCFQCHTRAAIGPAFGDRHLKLDQLKMDSTEKADVYIATRQYDLARKTLELTIDSSLKVNPMPMELEESLYMYLALMVRIEQDPAPVIERLTSLLQRDDLPVYFRRDATKWKKSLVAWQKDIRRGRQDGNKISQAKTLVAAGEKQKNRVSDRGGDIDFLRATAVLHRALQEKHSDKDRAEIYYLLGSTYENLRRYGGLDLYKAYYQSCMESAPKSGIAKNCYERYEENAYADFWEGGAQFSATPLKKRLKELKELIK
jgi:hypothetical protein